MSTSERAALPRTQSTIAIEQGGTGITSTAQATQPGKQCGQAWNRPGSRGRSIRQRRGAVHRDTRLHQIGASHHRFRFATPSPARMSTIPTSSAVPDSSPPFPPRRSSSRANRFASAVQHSNGGENGSRQSAAGSRAITQSAVRAQNPRLTAIATVRGGRHQLSRRGSTRASILTQRVLNHATRA